jgi:hypothetical protein
MIVIVTRSMAEQAGLINKKWAGGGPGPGGAGPRLLTGWWAFGSLTGVPGALPACWRRGRPDSGQKGERWSSRGTGAPTAGWAFGIMC